MKKNLNFIISVCLIFWGTCIYAEGINVTFQNKTKSVTYKQLNVTYAPNNKCFGPYAPYKIIAGSLPLPPEHQITLKLLPCKRDGKYGNEVDFGTDFRSYTAECGEGPGSADPITSPGTYILDKIIHTPWGIEISCHQ